MTGAATRQALPRQSRAAIALGIGVILASLWTLVKDGAPEHARMSVQINLPASREAKFQGLPEGRQLQRRRTEPVPELELAESTPAPGMASGARLDSCPVEPFTQLELHSEVRMLSGTATCKTSNALHPSQPARIGHGIAGESKGHQHAPSRFRRRHVQATNGMRTTLVCTESLVYRLQPSKARNSSPPGSNPHPILSRAVPSRLLHIAALPWRRLPGSGRALGLPCRLHQAGRQRAAVLSRHRQHQGALPGRRKQRDGTTGHAPDSRLLQADEGAARQLGQSKFAALPGQGCAC